MHSPIAAYITLLVPVSSLVGFVLALCFAINKRIPVERRRVLFNRAAYVPLITSICAFVPSAALFYHSPYLSTWFDGSKTGFMFFVVLIPVATIAVLLPFIRSVSIRCCPASDEPEIIPLDDVYASVWLRLLIWSAVTVFYAVYVYFAQPYSFVHFGSHFTLSRIVSSLSSMIWIPVFIIYTSYPRPSEISDELTKRARELAAVMNCRVREVRIITGKAGQDSAIALMTRKPKIYLSTKMINALSSAEIDFIIAHELGHAKLFELHRRKRTAQVIILLMLIQLVWCYIVFLLSVKSGAWLGIVLGGLPGLGMYMSLRELDPLARQKEYEADRLALEITRDLDSGISSLTKLKQLNSKPSAYESEVLSGHPAMSKRIKALRYHAEEMGIAVSESENQIREY